MRKDTYLEADLYQPVADFFLAQGFEVRSEVKGCDIVAVKGEQMIIIEMKKTFSLKLIYQAIARQTITPYVYVAIPRPQKPQTGRNWRDMLSLLKRLSLGLLTVAIDSELQFVEHVLPPGPNNSRKNTKKKNEVILELSKRSGEYNQGGVTKKKIATAYREKTIALACILEKFGALSFAKLKEFGFEQTELGILSRNYNQYFIREGKGVYCLSEKGKAFLDAAEFPALVAHYRKKYEAIEDIKGQQ